MFSRICRFCRLSHELREKQIISLGGVRYRRKLWHKPMLEDLYKRRVAQGPEPERPRSVWSNWNYDAEIYAFGQRLGEDFSEQTLNKAFLHSSYLESQKPLTEEDDQTTEVPKALGTEDNTEFIEKGGEFLLTHLRACLRSQYPRLPEDSIRSIAGELTSPSQLAYVGSHIGMKDLVIAAEFPLKNETLSDTFKAVVGALLHDKGAERAGHFVQDFVLTQLVGRDVNEWLGITDPMHLLVCLMKENGNDEPVPRLLFESASTTMEATYMVGIYYRMHLIAKGYGESVNIAEEMAARDALARQFGTSHDSSPVDYDKSIELRERNYKDNRSLTSYYQVKPCTTFHVHFKPALSTSIDIDE